MVKNRFFFYYLIFSYSNLFICFYTMYASKWKFIKKKQLVEFSDKSLNYRVKCVSRYPSFKYSNTSLLIIVCDCEKFYKKILQNRIIMYSENYYIGYQMLVKIKTRPKWILRNAWFIINNIEKLSRVIFMCESDTSFC